jgi:formylglycine-generating enzyme required for sulfatase activity
MKRIFISAILLIVIAAGANAQSKTLKVHKNGNVVYQRMVSSIDSVTFGDCETIVDSITVTVASSYTWRGQTYTVSGVYQQTFIAANSCDSVVTLTLTIIPFAYEPEMVTVPGGTTTLNSTMVTIDTFSIGKYEITQKIWEEVMGYSGQTSTGGTLSAITAYPGGFPDMPVAYGDGDYYPVYYVSYDDIVNNFLPRLNAITGKNYRLPTEAEWEYAAKGGQQTHNYTYSGSNTIGDVAWYYSNSSNTTHVVGIKLPNELGIYDMSGNVWEWCRDWYDDPYPSGANNPTGASTGSYRVIRGGSWSNNAGNTTVSIRINGTPSDRYNGVGFRLVLVP